MSARDRAPHAVRAPTRVRLTDQALVAVALARQAAAGRRAHVGHLLLGLASEPEGAAGRALRQADAALARLASRVAAASPRLPAIEVAAGWATREVEGRPLWTSDLLSAALEVGGAELGDLLEACGLDVPGRLLPRPDDVPPAEAATGHDALVETRGYDPADRTWTAPAARAVARVRAAGGGAVTLLVALAVEQAVAPDAVPLDPDELTGRLQARGSPTTLRLPAPNPGDRGLDAVVAAAERIRAPAEPLAPTDLLRAAVLAGGTVPAALLAPPREPDA